MIPGLERSPGERNDYPLQYSCLENSMDRAAWRATYSPRGCKELDMTERLSFHFLENVTNLKVSLQPEYITKVKLTK